MPDIAPANIKVAVVGRYNSYQYPSQPVYYSDTSDVNIPITTPPGTITVVNPNGGVTLNALTNYPITWTANGTSSGEICAQALYEPAKRRDPLRRVVGGDHFANR